jgi:iron complex transport system substrate-binding protein
MRPERGWRRPAAYLLAVICLAWTVAGCGSGETSRGTESPLPVRDGLGREIHLARRPARIVSMAPSVTESLVALGFGDRLVGVTDFCELPEGTVRPARVGGLLNPNLETIRALQPDLLIATTSGNDPSLATQAAGLDLPLYTLHTPEVADMIESLRALARVLGDPGAGERLAGSLETRLARAAGPGTGRRPRVLFVIWHDPLIVPGREAFLTDAIRCSGGDSVTADAAGAHPAFSLEAAIDRAPEVIFTTPENGAMVEALAGDPAWAAVPAVAAGRLHVLRPAVVRPGPGVVAGIEEMAGYLRAGSPKK